MPAWLSALWGSRAATVVNNKVTRWAARKAGKAALGAYDTTLRSFGGAGHLSQARKAKLDEWTLSDLRSRNASAVQRMAEIAWNAADIFLHSISVKVRGGPAADLRSCYYLALAAAFGRFGRSYTRISGSYFEMGCHTDVTHKEVTVTIGHRTSMWGDLIRGQRGFGKAGYRTPQDVMYEGPDQVTIGAGWAGPFVAGSGQGYNPNPTLNVGQGFAQSGGDGSTLRVSASQTVATGSKTETPQSAALGPTNVQWLLLDSELDLGEIQRITQPFSENVLRVTQEVDPFRELPVERSGTQASYLRRWYSLKANRTPYVLTGRTDANQMPVLPDDGRLITTGETLHPYVQPPKPPVDGVSRGGLLDLVAQTLSRPGYLPARPPVTLDGPVATGGVFVRQPGTVAVGEQAQVIRIAPPSVAAPQKKSLVASIRQFVADLPLFIRKMTAPKISEK